MLFYFFTLFNASSMVPIVECFCIKSKREKKGDKGLNN